MADSIGSLSRLQVGKQVRREKGKSGEHETISIAKGAALPFGMRKASRKRVKGRGGRIERARTMISHPVTSARGKGHKNLQGLANQGETAGGRDGARHGFEWGKMCRGEGGEGNWQSV